MPQRHEVEQDYPRLPTVLTAAALLMVSPLVSSFLGPRRDRTTVDSLSSPIPAVPLNTHES